MLKNFLKYKVKNSEMIHFFRKLALLTEAGLPVSGALDSAARGDYFKGIAQAVKSGGLLSAALDADVFPPAVIGIISVSERSGKLSSGLSRACQYLEKKEAFKKKVVGALLYPAFVLAFCCVSIFILASVLLPSFAGIFQAAGATLPPLSRFILNAGEYLPLTAVALLILSYFAVRYAASDAGFKVPVIGRFRSKLVLASFFNSMAASLSSGISVVDSLALSSNLTGSEYYKEKLLASLKAVSDGNALSESLHGTGLFDETPLSLISVGERSSSLDKVFSQLSNLYEEEIENALKTFSSLVEPVSTLATGLVVGIIVFAMFMPIIKLIGVLGG
ncbi:MAG: type II secretion system F family protein [bacterium]